MQNAPLQTQRSQNLQTIQEIKKKTSDGNVLRMWHLPRKRRATTQSASPVAETFPRHLEYDPCQGNATERLFRTRFLSMKSGLGAQNASPVE